MSNINIEGAQQAEILQLQSALKGELDAHLFVNPMGNDKRFVFTPKDQPLATEEFQAAEEPYHALGMWAEYDANPLDEELRARLVQLGAHAVESETEVSFAKLQMFGFGLLNRMMFR